MPTFLRQVWLLLAAPKTLAELAAHEVGDRPEAHVQFARSIQLLRRGLFQSLLLVAGAVSSALLAAQLLHLILGPASPLVIRLLQISGIGILLWATLAKQGWSIETVNGVSMPERLDQKLFRVLYLIGSFILALSTFWSAP